jgi:hypothetical protein
MSKSQHTSISPIRKKKIKLEINRQPIPYVKEANYLGMNLDVRLKWKAHIKKKTNSK